MKKIVFLAFATLMLVSCGGNKPKESSIGNKALKGEWTLQNITYNQKGKFNITLLNDTSKECFEGSTWKFVPNNNRGIYTINNGDCSTGSRNFVFVVQEIDKSSGYYDFLIKTDQRQIPVGNQSGYSFAIGSLIRNQYDLGTNRKCRR